MKYLELGKTGLRVSRMGFGGIPIQQSSQEDVTRLIAHLHKNGINFIDSARGYTISEERIGVALQGIREDFILATKSMARSFEEMERDIQTSLKNFQTDVIDLYQIHNPSMADLEKVCGPDGALKALLLAKEQGHVRHLGLTAHSLEVFEHALTLDWVETIMFPYNIVETQAEELIQRCKEKKIGFICMKPLAGGAIEDATIALRFISQNAGVSVLIPGVYKEEEANQNQKAIEDESSLTQKEEEQIAKIRQELGTNFCRRCNYCQPCPQKINISGCFLFEGYLSRYGLEQWAIDRYQAMPVKASACVKCGLCESRCPYQLPIRNMLENCVQKFGE